MLRVHACGVCRTDLHLLDGEVPIDSPPRILGHQIVGIVEARGEAREEGDEASLEEARQQLKGIKERAAIGARSPFREPRRIRLPAPAGRAVRLPLWPPEAARSPSQA